MKKRQKFTVSERNLPQCVEFGREEARLRKKISSNPLIQKNLNFLHTYNNVFRKPSQHFGDADTHFRKSLRNYGAFDLIREFNLESNLGKSQDATESLLSKRSEAYHTHYPKQKSSNKFTLKRVDSEYSFTELYSTTKDLERSDTETEPFYSPNENLHNLEKEPEDTSVEELNNERELEKSHLDIPEQEGPPDLEEPELEEPELEAFGLQYTLTTPKNSRADEDSDSEPEERRNSDLEVIQEEQAKMEGEDLANATTDEGEEEDRGDYAEFIPTEGEGTEGETTDAGGTDGDVTEGLEEGGGLEEVEQMIQQASKELQEVADENRQLLETLNEEEDTGEQERKVKKEKDDKMKVPKKEPEAAGIDAGDTGSYFKFDPKIDAAIIVELDAAEQQAKTTAKTILKLKERVQELLKTDKMTEAEAKELEEKNQELRCQMILFEETTKRIQGLITQSNLFETMKHIQPPLQKKHNEDLLPKVVVCGLTENNMPKIIVCEDNNQLQKKRRRRSASCTPASTRSCSPSSPTRDASNQKAAMPNFQGNFLYSEQQGSFDNKDQTIQCLQRQLCTLQTQMRMVNNNNMMQQQPKQDCSNPSCPKNSRPSSPKRKGGRGGCGPGAGICPADIVNKLKEYSETTQLLERQLGDMEEEVRDVQKEIVAVQKEREHLEHHRKQLCRMPPCVQPPCGPSPPCRPPPCPPKPGIEQALNELREQYNRLQDDFKAKLTEVAGLRAENAKLKEAIEAAVEAQAKAENKLKECEHKIKMLLGETKGEGISKEYVVELEQQVKTYKEMHRQAQDELEELRACVEDLQCQVNDYRNKYLEAEQTVEEHRRQIELMKLESNRVSEQVNLEIQKVKNQFQEKLQELAPLPDILKATQVKLQEAQQMHLLAERNNEALARELQMYKDKLQAIQNELQGSQSNLELGENELSHLKKKVKDLEEKVAQLEQDNHDLNEQMLKLEEESQINERLASERAHEITQLNSQLESVREDCARQISKIKDRCNIVRKSMQNQITDLERQLAQTKAVAKAAEKDRDEVRQKMQSQINNLNSNFEDALMRIRNLQGHVNFLKNTYGPIFPCEEPKQTKPDPCSCGVDY